MYYSYGVYFLIIPIFLLVYFKMENNLFCRLLSKISGRGNHRIHTICYLLNNFLFNLKINDFTFYLINFDLEYVILKNNAIN